MTNHPNRSWRRRLASEAAALGPDLLAAWEALVSRHGTLTAGCALMSTCIGATYTAHDVGKWRRGERPIPIQAERHMRRCVLMALRLDGIADVLEP